MKFLIRISSEVVLLAEDPSKKLKNHLAIHLTDLNVEFIFDKKKRKEKKIGDGLSPLVLETNI